MKSGAVKPPWITKGEFYRLPFNFCDRWCKHCELTSICKVYKEEQKDRKRALKEGKDPDSMEFAFEVVHKNLEKTFKLLYKGAKKWGIDLKKIEEDAKNEDWNKEPDYQNDPIYQTALNLSKRIHVLLNKFEYISIETDAERMKEEVEIISWYNPLFTAKISRALSSHDEENRLQEDLKSYDDMTSAFIAYRSLEKLSNSFLNLAEMKGLLYPRKKLLTLSSLCLSLAQILDKKFGLFKEKDDLEN